MAAKTKKKPKTAMANGSPEPVREVLTLAEAAAFLRLSESAVLRLALDGRLPGRAAESQWRFLRSALRIWLAGTDFAKPSPTAAHLSDKERLLAVAGCLADDDSLEAMVEEIYRERKRNPVGGSS
jgi:excisionase family DNA binding protein